MTDEEYEKHLKEKEARDSNPYNKERYYVTNAELLEELVKWRDSNKEEEQKVLAAGGKINYTERVISEKLGFMFMELAKKITNHSSFRNYPIEIKQDMCSYAYEKMITGLPNYNFNYTNAFAYLS